MNTLNHVLKVEERFCELIARRIDRKLSVQEQRRLKALWAYLSVLENNNPNHKEILRQVSEFFDATVVLGWVGHDLCDMIQDSPELILEAYIVTTSCMTPSGLS